MHHAAHNVFPIIGAHVIGMYALVIVVGRIIDRIGRQVALFGGLILMALSVISLLWIESVPATAVALFGLGLGWNFSFVAATAELADSTLPSERGRLMGFNDLLSGLTGAGLALLGGAALESLGVAALALGAAALVCAPALWLASRPGRSSAPPPSSPPPAATRSWSGGQLTGSRFRITRSAAIPGRRRPRRFSACSSHAGATQVAWSASSTVTACSGRQDGRSSMVRSTPATMPGERVELLHGRVRAVRERRAGVQQRAVRVGALPSLPQPLGEVAVRGRVAELDGCRHADLGEARHVGVVEQLRVLDPLAQAARRPLVAGGLEGVERRAVRGVADRVHRHRPAGGGRPPDHVLEHLARADLHARAVQQPRGGGAERPVHEALQVAEAQHGVAEAGR